MPTAAAEARHWCRSQISDLFPPTLTDDALLVVSELVTNALRANCRLMTLSLSVDGDCLSIIVCDDAAGQPVMTRAAETDESGRGLSIVASLSAASGVRTRDNGKEVWALLPVPAQLVG